MKLIFLMVLGLSGVAAELSEEDVSTRIEKALDLFAPIAKFVSGIDKPASQAVVDFCEREGARASKERVRNWKEEKEITKLEDLLPWLYNLKTASAGRNPSFSLPGIRMNVDMGDLWLEILQRAWSMPATYKVIDGMVNIMEKMGVKRPYIAAYCNRVANVARGNFLDFAPPSPEEGTTFYKTWQGENTEEHISGLLECVQISKVYLTSASILGYIRFLDWKGGANWWEVFQALQKAEKTFEGCHGSGLNSDWGDFFREDIRKTWLKFFREDSRGEERFLNESLTLRECMEESKKEGWECPHLVMCAAADVPYDILMDLAKTDQEQYDFWQRCRRIYAEKAESALVIFVPVINRIQQSNSRACKAVQSLYCKARSVRPPQEKNSVWDKSQPVINDIGQLRTGLRALELNCAQQGMESFEWPGRLFGADMGKIFLDLNYDTQTLFDVIEITNLMQRVGVHPDFVLQYCFFSASAVCEAPKGQFFRTWSWRSLDSEATAYKFFYGQNIDQFVSHIILNEESDGFVHWSIADYLSKYVAYLSWKGSVNWWGFLLGLYKGGASRKGRLAPVFASVCKQLLNEVGDCDKAYDYLESVIEQGQLSAGLKQEALEGLLDWLVRYRQGASALWIDKRQMKNVSMSTVSQMLEIIHLSMREKTLSFFDFAVQSLPTERMLQKSGGVQCLPEGFYKNLVEGKSAMPFLSEMVLTGSLCKEGQAQAERNAAHYIGYLAPKLSLEKLVDMLKSVPSLQKGQEVVSSLLWGAIKAKKEKRVEPLLQYLKFLLQQEGMSLVYAEKEIDEVCHDLHALGGQRVAEAFLRNHCSECSTAEQLSLRTRANKILQQQEQESDLTEWSLVV